MITLTISDLILLGFGVNIGFLILYIWNLRRRVNEVEDYLYELSHAIVEAIDGRE